ncbi:unnamed protein product [Peniophora sp. CBMAI 1063]|nr:unnamed protein product [Peniophora sp. CBMAI 1063]
MLPSATSSRNRLQICTCRARGCGRKTYTHPSSGDVLPGQIVDSRELAAHRRADESLQLEENARDARLRRSAEESAPTSSPEPAPTLFECRSLRELRALNEQLSDLASLNMLPEDYIFLKRPNSATKESDVTPNLLSAKEASNAPFFTRLEALDHLSSSVEGVEISSDAMPHAMAERDALVTTISTQFSLLAEALSLAYYTQATTREAEVARRVADGTIFDTRLYLEPPLRNMRPPVAAICIMIGAALLLLGCSEDDCRFLLSGMIITARLFYKDAGTTDDVAASRSAEIPKDPRHVLKEKLRLDRTIKYTSWISCPSCYACYDDHGPGSYPERCTMPPSPDGDPCDEVLTRTRTFGNRVWTYPVRRILIQDLKAWVAWFLSRPGILESLIPEVDLKDVMSDIWHASGLTTFMGPDGKPFMTVQAGEVRLVFALNVDGFNPFQMKEAGRKATSTAMYMVCLNLPPNVRYRVENMFLVGIIPGPNEPSTFQINNILALLVYMLLEFWQDGVSYDQLPLHDDGVLVRLALLLIVCDTPAARQVCGFGAHNHNFFCPFCLLKYPQRDNVDRSTWIPRSLEHYRDCSERWRQAKTQKERKSVYAESGVRYTALSELPYWNPFRMVVIDIMHALFEGNLKRMCRAFWGISAAQEDGDGTTSDPSPLPTPDALLDELWRHVRASPLTELRKMRLDHLRALIIRYNVPITLLTGRSKNEKEPHVRALEAYRIEKGWFNAQGERLGELHPDQLPRSELEILELRAHPAELAALDDYFQYAPDMDEFMVFSRRVLIASLIIRKSLGPKDSQRHAINEMSKRVLIGQLQSMRVAAGIIHSNGELVDDSDDTIDHFHAAQRNLPGSARKKSVILGRRRLLEVWADMARTIMPTWMGKAPFHMGDGKHRKASADDWRLFVLINLVVTMVRLWGKYPAMSRERQLLDNFLHLVSATKIAAYRGMSVELVQSYVYHMTAWLKGLTELFPGIHLESQQHLSLHLDVFLIHLGPTHAWRCFVFERWNYLLQLINTNNHLGRISPLSLWTLLILDPGELELTMFYRLILQQRLRAMVFDGGLSSELKEFEPAFQALLHKDKRGTMLNDILALNTDAPPPPPPPPPRPSRKFKGVIVEEAILRQLAELAHRRTGLSPDPKLVQPIEVKTIDVGSVSFSSEAPNCYVGIGPHFPGDWRLAKVHRLFMYAPPGKPSEGARSYYGYAVVRYFRLLDEEEVGHDTYRQWSFIGGRLHHADVEPELHVLPVEDILFHCCVTQWDAWDGIDGPVILGLPGDRLQ